MRRTNVRSSHSALGFAFVSRQCFSINKSIARGGVVPGGGCQVDLRNNGDGTFIDGDVVWGVTTASTGESFSIQRLMITISSGVSALPFGGMCGSLSVCTDRKSVVEGKSVDL